MLIDKNILTVDVHRVKSLALSFLDEQLDEDYIDRQKHYQLSQYVSKTKDRANILVNIMGIKLVSAKRGVFSYAI